MARTSRMVRLVSTFALVMGLVLVTLGGTSGQPPPPPEKVVVSTVYDGPAFYTVTLVNGVLTAQKQTTVNSGTSYKVVYDWVTDPKMTTKQKKDGSGPGLYWQVDVQGKKIGGSTAWTASETEPVILATGETKPLAFTWTPASAGSYKIQFQLYETGIETKLVDGKMKEYRAEAKTVTKDVTVK